MSSSLGSPASLEISVASPSPVPSVSAPVPASPCPVPSVTSPVASVSAPVPSSAPSGAGPTGSPYSTPSGAGATASNNSMLARAPSRSSNSSPACWVTAPIAAVAMSSKFVSGGESSS